MGTSRLRIAVFAAGLPAALGVALPAHGSQACDVFLGTGAGLSDFVEANECTLLPPGTYEIPRTIYLRPGADVIGLGPRQTVVIRPAATFAGASLIYQDDPGSVSSPGSVLRGLTLDGSSSDGDLLNSLVGRAGILIEDSELRNTRCYAVNVNDVNVRIVGNLFTRNGLSCGSAPPGAAVYAIDPEPNDALRSSKAWAPVITGNEFALNNGPAVDSSGVTGGVFTGNYVHDGLGETYAGIALFGSGGWTIADNVILNPPGNLGYPYPNGNCHLGPGGITEPAAIFLCQRDDSGNRVTTQNAIHDNVAISYWGILLTGNDETKPYWAPRNNTLTGNVVATSVVGCADDFAPGQWASDMNVWAGNSCPAPQTF